MKNLSLILLALFITAQASAAEPLWQGKGRIAVSCDGNEHDHDDWAATPMTLAILAWHELQNQVSLYVYSDHVWGSSHDFPNTFGHSAYEHMHLSALGSKKWFGYKKTPFICAVDDPEKAYNAMASEIDKSSEQDPIIIIAAGPMQVVGEALKRSQESKHKYVTMISHSGWNNGHAANPKKSDTWDVHSGWSWAQMKKNFTEVKFVDIINQNGGKTHKGLSNEKHYYDWIKSKEGSKGNKFKKGAWDFLYSRIETCVKKNDTFFDVSDAGMALFLLTGDDKTSPEKLEEFFSK